MKILAIILNVFLPGVGTLVLGKVTQGVVQIILYWIGVALCFTIVGAIIGGPLALAMWIWGIVVAAQANPEPVKVVVVHENGRGAEGKPQ